MTDKDVKFLQGIAEQILLYCANARIDNKEINALADARRAAFKIFNTGVITQPGTETVNSSEDTGGEELIKLKYGQGHIARKTRIRKKDNSVSVYYEGRYYNEFGKVKSVYARTQKECARLLKEAQKDKKKKGRQVSPSLGEWITSWYTSFKVDSIRPSTRRNYEAGIKVISEGLGKIKLNDLTGETLQKFFKTIPAGNSRKKLYVLLSGCLDKAVVLRKMEYNPCHAVELPKYKKQRRRPFTYEEQDIICNEAPENLSQVFFFLCVTGLRVGEFLALTKDDFFFDEHFFKVDKAIAAGVEGEPKSEAGNRIVYFTDELFKNFNLDLLGKYTYAGLRSAMDRFNQSHGIKGVSLHCTRHTFATVCHSLGMNEKVLQTLLGHSTLAMTQDTYTHLLKKGASKVYYYLKDLCAFIRSTTF